MSEPKTSVRIQNPVLLICDLQEKFRSAIYEFSSVIATAQKVLHAASILDIPVIVTTQTRAKLGEVCPELELGQTYHTVADVDKTRFSMWVPEVTSAIEQLHSKTNGASNNSATPSASADILLLGIETHICILQTTLDALAHGHRVWIVQDGVSSCNKEERSIALARMRQEGARITTSESLLFELMVDANSTSFKQIAALVKNTKDTTSNSLKKLGNNSELAL